MIKFIASKKKVFFTTIFLFAFLLLTAYGYKNHIYTANFVDEEDNFTVAKYLQNGERLYTDIFSHHQPIPYFLSEGIQTVIPVDTVFQTVKMHRIFMIVWAIGWSLLLFFRFRYYAIPFIVIYELTKISLIGHTFLAEALVVYPLVYLLLSVLTKTTKKFELIFIGVIAAFIALTLSPLWPLIALFVLVTILKLKEKKLQNILFIAGGFLGVLVATFCFISLSEYIHNTVYLNATYYIPSTALHNAIFKSFFSPVLFLVSDVALFIKVISLSFIGLLGYFIVKRNFKTALLMFLILGLANIRYSVDEFHLLPWYGLIVGSISYLVVNFLTQNKKIHVSKKIVAGTLVLLIIFCFYQSKDTLFKKINSEEEAHIHYSQQYDYGKAVELMADAGDSLMVVPVEPLILWQANTPHATKYPYYYIWMSGVPEIKTEVTNIFETNPPTFFYLNLKIKEGGEDLAKYLSQYKNIKKNNKETFLYIKKEKIEKLNENQINQLKNYNFTL